jgi:hypothetical protein
MGLADTWKFAFVALCRPGLLMNQHWLKIGIARQLLNKVSLTDFQQNV